MSPLTGFIIVITAITIQFTLFAIKRMQEPLEPRVNYLPLNERINNPKVNYWRNAEITNGRLAMLGLLAVFVNYGLFGWIIPGFV